MKYIFVTFFITTSLLGIFCPCDSQVAPQVLRKSLVDLYKATAGESWLHNTNWNTDTDVCTWYGVTCLEHMHNVTTDLSLKSNNLVGKIPESITLLKDLKTLDLSGNKLTGPIPSTISNLFVLRFLYLNNNQLTGPLPKMIYNQNVTYPVGTYLRELNLEQNQLDGNIPESWFGPSQAPTFPPPVNLQVINMRYNNLTGTIPSSISNAHDLTTLLLSYNKMTGDLNASQVLDSWLGTRKYCDLNGNDWKGTIPDAVKKAYAEHIAKA